MKWGVMVTPMLLRVGPAGEGVDVMVRLNLAKIRIS